MLRIIIIPVFLALMTEVAGPVYWFISAVGAGGAIDGYNAFVKEGGGHIAAGLVFVAAFATDALDGYIARKKGLVTDFGIFLDPIADKLLVAAALIALVANGAIGAWVAVLMISREFIVTGLRLIAAGKGKVLAAGGFGKAKTAAQSVALTLLIFRNFGIGMLDSINAGLALLYVALAFTVLSGADYIIKNKDLLAGA